MPCRNVGGIDRALRVSGGAILLGAGLALAAAGHDHGWTAALVGVPVLASGILGFCPPYVLLGISTAKPSARCACRGSGGDPAPR